MHRLRIFLSLLFAFCLLTSCENQMMIVSNLEEREANEIVVFLASKGIDAKKMQSISSSPGAAQGGSKWSISVNKKDSTDAMAILNQNGLPRIKGVNLLDLFAKQGLMSSEKEETIRYQAGLAEQIATTIRKIDGVIDADVQISFPTGETTALGVPGEASSQKITAAVYVKHQGILDDPNSHLILKIKRLVAGSINGLDLNDVTVISDKARFTDIGFGQTAENMTIKAAEKEYVSIWSIVMSKSSASRFRTLFFLLSICTLLFGLLALWIIWKIYPSLREKGGIRGLFKSTPLPSSETHEETDKNSP